MREMPDDAIKVRPSAYSTWQNCALSVQYTSDPRYDSTSSMQAARGTGMHLPIEQHLKGDPFLTEKHMREAWVEELKARPGEWEKLGTLPAETFRTVAAQIWEGYLLWQQQFWQTVGQHLTVVATERKLSMPIGEAPDGREIWLRGTPDFIDDLGDGTDRVIDWKTSTSGWKAAKVNEMVQHIAYAALHQANGGRDVSQAMYVVYNFKDKSWSWDEFKIPVLQSKVDLVLAEFVQMGRVLSIGGATASPMKRGPGWGQDGRGWWCSPKWCGAWDFCEGKLMLDDGQGHERRDSLITWR